MTVQDDEIAKAFKNGEEKWSRPAKGAKDASAAEGIGEPLLKNNGDEEPRATVVVIPAEKKTTEPTAENLEEEEEERAQAGEWDPVVIPRRYELANAIIIFSMACVSEFFECIFMIQGYADTNPTPVDAMALLSNYLWFHGFCVLTHWVIARSGCNWANMAKAELAAAVMKGIASFLFLVQPMDSAMNGGAGCVWLNVVAVCIFHSGNMIASTDVLVWSANKGGFLYSAPLSRINFGHYGTLSWTIATGIFTVTTIFNYCANEGVSNVPSSHATNIIQLVGGCFLIIGATFLLLYVQIVPRFGLRPAGMPEKVYAVEVTF